MGTERIKGPNAASNATHLRDLVINDDGSINFRQNSQTVLRAEINTATSGDNTIIAASTGNSIRISHMTMQNTSAAATTVIMKNGSVTVNGTGFLFAASGGSYAFDAPGGVGGAEIILTSGSAFKLNLSAANRLVGYVLYWLEGD